MSEISPTAVGAVQAVLRRPALAAEKAAVIRETLVPGARILNVARR